MKTYCFVLLILLCSCQQKTENKSFPTNKLLGKEIVFDETFDIIDMIIVDDYLVVTSAQSDTLVHIYSLPDIKLVSKMGLKGEAPFNLVYSLLFKGSGSKLIIGGFDNGKAVKYFQIQDDIVTEIQTSKVFFNEALNDAYAMNDSILIYNSIFDLTLRKINIKNHSVSDICQFPKDNHQESFFYSNKGKLGINNTSIVYAYFYKDQIDFMDLTGKLIKRIVGKNDSSSISIDNMNMNYMSYVNLYAGTNYFYLLHRGQTLADYINNNLNDRLEVYSGDGQIQNEYSFEIPPIIFVVDEKRNILYGYNGMYKDVLLVYKLEQS